jgi:hypothetical protein
MRTLGAVLLIASCAPAVEERACNGHVELCTRTLDEVVLAGAHNAMASSYDNFAVPNQALGIAEQLELGVRAFLLDTYETDEGLFFCHTNCLLGAIPMLFQLDEIRSFLERNPNEVIAFLIEDYIEPTQFESAMTDAQLANQTVTNLSLTLGELLDRNERILVVSEHAGPPPAWYHPMYESIFVDTPFDFSSVDELRSPESCSLLRGQDANPLLLVNHWVADPVPSAEIAAETNTSELLVERATRCAQERGHAMANVVAVDFVETGDLISVVDTLNGL